ncbi:MAG: malate/lactate/ureidoglycolate dehydrogenase [Rhodospirillaceae bacterium]|nr:malate/lactate/ureidoglycolate dehydrogenase [Rhodospirillaceae bacterium]
MTDVIVNHEKLRTGIAALLDASGSAAAEARIVTDHLVEANLKGHDSHGVGMIPAYMRNLGSGALKLNQHIKLVRDDGPFLVGDGQMGHGQVVAMELTELAIARAKAQGMAVAGLVRSHHIGRVGTYGERCAEAGLVSLHFVNVAGHRGLVAPFRGTDGRFNTNPICLTIPATATQPPLILDFATSKIALGKVRVAKNKGQQVAAGTLLDSAGKPTTDPTVMFTEQPGAVVTFGEHKGYGLALFAELFGAALIGGHTIAPRHDRHLGTVNNMLVIAIDPARLTDLGELKREIDDIVGYFKASPPFESGVPVLVPGEPERMNRAARLVEGIPIDETTWGELRAAADFAKLGAAKFETLVR